MPPPGRTHQASAAFNGISSGTPTVSKYLFLQRTMPALPVRPQPTEQLGMMPCRPSTVMVEPCWSL